MDLYVILGVDTDASLNDLKRAYKRLARRYHPDINPGDHEAEAFFRRATEAYETLIDPDRRRLYDSKGLPTSSSDSASVEFHGFDFSVPATGASVTFSELFGEVLPETIESKDTFDGKGSDLYGEISLSFEESLQGVERKLTITRLNTCSACDGSGLRRAPETRCGFCLGAGTVRWRRGHMVFSKSCENCEGTGLQRQQPCSTCRSEGTVARTEDILIQVPAGVHDGARMRVPSKGNVGRGQSNVGDLYITAKVSEHRFFERQGDDLYLKVPVEVHEAALGANIEIPTINGSVRLRVPAGTQSGQRFRVRGRGSNIPRTGKFGDLIVEVQLVLPLLKDERSKELLREFGKINANDVRHDLFIE